MEGRPRPGRATAGGGLVFREAEKDELINTASFWRSIPTQDALDLLSRLRGYAELGAPIVQARLEEERANAMPKCEECGKPLHGAFYNVFQESDAKTGLQRAIYSCSARCYSVVARATQETKRLSMVR